MKSPLTAISHLSLPRLALTGASTASLVLLGIMFAVFCTGTLHSLTTTQAGVPLFEWLIYGTTFALAVATLLAIIVTAVLQILRPQPRLTKTVTKLAFAWPVMTFGLYGMSVLVLSFFDGLSLSYAVSFAVDCLFLIVIFTGMIAAMLVIPAFRNNLFCRAD